MKYNIYKTTNLVNGKYYWGVHNSIDENDGYLGSGTILLKAIKKYGKDSFRRKMMVTYETAAAAFFDEGLLVTQKYLDENPMCYNVYPGGKGGSNKGRKLSEQMKKKLSIIGKLLVGERNPFYGKRHSEETKKKQSEIKLGENGYWYGKHLSEETKQKQRIKASDGKNKGENNPMSKMNRAKRALQMEMI